MMEAIAQNIRSFYDTTVFFVILAIGLFLILWDYPIFKAMKFKDDARITLIMGILYLILPFALILIMRI